MKYEARTWLRGVCVSAALGAAAAAAVGCSSEGAPVSSAEGIGTARDALATPTLTFPGSFYADTATRLNDGRVLVAGGLTKSGTTDAATTATAIYDPSTNQWASTGSLMASRIDPTAIRMADGRVLISGGKNLSTSLASNEVYNPATGTFTTVFGDLAVPRWGHAAVLLNNGSIMVAGGSTAQTTTAMRAEIVGGGTVSGWMGPWHGRVSLTRASGGSILALYDAEAWMYAEPSGTWTKVASPLLSRRGQRVIRLDDGRLLMLGGDATVPNPNGIGSTSVPTASVELYDPATNVWSPTGSLSRPPGQFDDLVNVPGGDVLLIGSKLRVERYSAATGTWSLREPLSKTPMAAVTLESGAVLVLEAAPVGSNYFTSAEVYDPSSPLCAQMTCQQQGAACGALDDGCGDVLLCGSCPSGQFCNNNACFCDSLTTCAAQGKTCGIISDGCGGTLSCGTCAAGQSCTNNVCTSAPTCAHSECVSGTKLTSSCSSCAQTVCAADPFCCNSSWDSACVSRAKAVCSVCASTCTPTTCSALGKNCGSVSNGCGGTLSCGTCAAGQTCTNNVCTACTPTTCSALGKNCGSVSNGCGGTLSCGTCAAGQTCTNNVCTTPPPSGTCAHSQCTTGAKLTSGCTSCVASICAVDPYCCSTAWDSICVGRVASTCQLSCP
jgi:hypothetical protein